MNDTATNLADASQNLRSGMNFLVRDLVQAGRQIPTGGIPIPSGASPADHCAAQPARNAALLRQHEPLTALMAITTGKAGPRSTTSPPTW